MPKIDPYEEEILSAYEEGKLKSVATKEELAKFKAVAGATPSRTDGEHPSVGQQSQRLSGQNSREGIRHE